MDGIISFILDRPLEIAGLLVGLAYLYFEYHAKRLMWLMSVVMPLISLRVYYKAGLYADFYINIYYLFIAIYGYIAWTIGFDRAKRTPLKVTNMRKAYYIPVTMVLAAIYALLAWVLIDFTDSTVPYWDAFTTALSIVALWMLAHKYVQQWLAWFVVDAVSVGLYIYKEIYFYAVLYAVYTFIALLGYRKWLQMIGEDR